ncbi:MAG TPA: gamma carbonic anhydrase family protein [Acidimicrobiia bacterium]|nr:gamma carbonic anhydrase family protein [Acidimicrobiia bacterium]
MSAIHLPDPDIDPTALIAPGAHVHGRVSIGAGVSVFFGVVIRAELDRIDIGAETNVQDNVVVHCDDGVPCRMGQRVTVGHSAVVHGAEVGDRCLVGIGAMLLNGSRLGEGSWLASGSILTEGREIPPWTLAVGIPAKPARELTVAEIERADRGVNNYLELIEPYRRLFGAVPRSE